MRVRAAVASGGDVNHYLLHDALVVRVAGVGGRKPEVVAAVVTRISGPAEMKPK